MSMRSVKYYQMILDGSSLKYTFQVLRVRVNANVPHKHGTHISTLIAESQLAFAFAFAFAFALAFGSFARELSTLAEESPPSFGTQQLQVKYVRPNPTS